MTHHDWPLVRKGNTDDDAIGNVTIVQHLLNAHDAGMQVDGIFGDQTDAAVRNFQQSRGLGVDGIVGNQTWPALVVQVSLGSRGHAVRALQSAFPNWTSTGSSASRPIRPCGSSRRCSGWPWTASWGRGRGTPWWCPSPSSAGAALGLRW